MPTIEILRTQEFSELTPSGSVAKKMRVTWRIDEAHGPYVDTFPSVPFDASAARRALEARAAGILALSRGF